MRRRDQCVTARSFRHQFKEDGKAQLLRAEQRAVFYACCRKSSKGGFPNGHLHEETFGIEL